MIKSPKQYEVTKRRLAEFEAAIAEFDVEAIPAHVSPGGHRAAYDALLSVREQLRGELERFNRLRDEGLSAVHFERLSDLPKALIQTRLARRMTQTALAEALDVAPQQVQRWENDEYDKTGLAYVLEIGDVLGFDDVLRRPEQRGQPKLLDQVAVKMMMGSRNVVNMPAHVDYVALPAGSAPARLYQSWSLLPPSTAFENSTMQAAADRDVVVLRTVSPIERYISNSQTNQSESLFSRLMLPGTQRVGMGNKQSNALVLA